MGGIEAARAWRERLTLAALAAAGLVLSGYLAAFQLGAVAAPWDPLFGPASSARVLHSGLSRALPVPDALLGAVGYLAELVIGLAGGGQRWRTHPWLVVLFAALAAVMGAVGVALTVVQAVVVHHGCTLCLCSAALSVTIAIAAAAGGELRAALHTLSPGRAPRRA